MAALRPTSFLTAVGIAVMIVGIAVVAAGILLEGTRGERGRVKGGAVVMIGPIPIVFGSDVRWAVIAIILAMALTVIGLYAFVI